MNVRKATRRGTKPSRNKPLTIKSGNTSVRIYQGTSLKGGVRYPLHTLSYYEGGERKRQTFADLAEAKREADKIANRLDNGDHDAARMSNSDAQAVAIAKRELASLDTPILEAVRAFVTATKALPPGTSLLAAAKFYASRHTSRTKRKLIPDIVREFLKTKTEDGLSIAYLKPLRSLLAPNEADAKTKPRKSFANSFQTYIDGVATADMDSWIRARGVGPRRRRNITLILRTLFNFARDMGYLPKDTPTEADGLALPKKKGSEIGIFTPAELHFLLTGSKAHPLNEEYKLWLTIGAFSGLRTAEMLRLKWGEHVQVGKAQIVISGDIAKTSSRRIIKMPPNLTQWLAGYAGSTGKIFEARADERAHRYASRFGVPWKPNALRHSFISYSVASRKDIPAVSYEAGNSPAIIKTNYMELVDESAATEWFGIMPEMPANVVAIKGAA